MEPQPAAAPPQDGGGGGGQSSGDGAVQAMKCCSVLFWLAMSESLQQFISDSQQAAQDSAELVIPVMMAAYIPVAVGAPPGNTFLCITSGLFYGWWGLLICLGWGAICASSAGFLLCRTFGRRGIEQLVSTRPRMQALKLALDENAFLVTVVARVSPILPYGPSTVVMSVSAIELRVFVVGTFLGLVPYDCAAVYFGTTIADLSEFDQITQRPVTVSSCTRTARTFLHSHSCLTVCACA
jgi:uncharacterized membrane protein YdjX (TVP38/TMEM64 family)